MLWGGFSIEHGMVQQLNGCVGLRCGVFGVERREGTVRPVALCPPMGVIGKSWSAAFYRVYYVSHIMSIHFFDLLQLLSLSVVVVASP